MLETRVSLIDRVRDPNDAASWHEFVSLYRPLLLNFVRKHGLKLGMQDIDVDDVVQDVLIGLARRLPTFNLDHDRARFRTYLWQATHHASINWLRQQRREDNVKQLDDEIAALQVAANSQPDDDWVSEQRRRVFQFAVEHVRERTQDKTWACFEGHLLHGRSAAEVAQALGVSSNVVFVNASRVLTKVREKCRECLEELSNA